MKIENFIKLERQDKIIEKIREEKLTIIFGLKIIFNVKEKTLNITHWGNRLDNPPTHEEVYSLTKFLISSIKAVNDLPVQDFSSDEHLECAFQLLAPETKDKIIHTLKKGLTRSKNVFFKVGVPPGTSIEKLLFILSAVKIKMATDLLDKHNEEDQKSNRRKEIHTEKRSPTPSKAKSKILQSCIND